MAYTVNEYRVTVRGALDTGEIWNNVWTVLDTVGGQSVTELAAPFHAFYESVFATSISSEASHTGATVKNLNTNVVTELVWEGGVGDDLANLMPTQCAIRVSLSGTGGSRGGPFLAGWSKNAVEQGGFLVGAEQALLIGAAETLFEALEALGWTLRIDKPSTATTTQVTQIRIGQRFDVIRKRAGELAESYAVYNPA